MTNKKKKKIFAKNQQKQHKRLQMEVVEKLRFSKSNNTKFIVFQATQQDQAVQIKGEIKVTNLPKN